MASIHVKDYDLLFACSQKHGGEVQPILSYREGAVAFLKVYLMPFQQFEKLIC